MRGSTDCIVVSIGSVLELAAIFVSDVFVLKGHISKIVLQSVKELHR